MPRIVYDVPMQSQMRFGVGLFVDLNCGWYCETAAMRYWAQRYGRAMPADAREVLPYSRGRFGYSPDDEGEAFATGRDKPETIDAWHDLLRLRGPTVVRGEARGRRLGRPWRRRPLHPHHRRRYGHG